jgi:hypothetical protein
VCVRYLAPILLILSMSNAVSAVRITNDRGGHIGSYVIKYQRLASAGESVIIDGLCASACTILLSELPRDKICVTSRAMLGFHAAWNFGPNGRTSRSRSDLDAILYLTEAGAPLDRKAGGLRSHIIFLSGKPLRAMYRPC